MRTRAMARPEHPGVGRILLVLGAFLIVGVPMVAVVWNAVNRAVAGDVGQLLVAAPLLLVFVGFLFLFGRGVQWLERRP